MNSKNKPKPYGPSLWLTAEFVAAEMKGKYTLDQVTTRTNELIQHNLTDGQLRHLRFDDDLLPKAINPDAAPTRKIQLVEEWNTFFQLLEVTPDIQLPSNYVATKDIPRNRAVVEPTNPDATPNLEDAMPDTTITDSAPRTVTTAELENRMLETRNEIALLGKGGHLNVEEEVTALDKRIAQTQAELAELANKRETLIRLSEAATSPEQMEKLRTDLLEKGALLEKIIAGRKAEAEYLAQL